MECGSSPDGVCIEVSAAFGDVNLATEGLNLRVEPRAKKTIVAKVARAVVEHLPSNLKTAFVGGPVPPALPRWVRSKEIMNRIVRLQAERDHGFDMGEDELLRNPDPFDPEKQERLEFLKEYAARLKESDPEAHGRFIREIEKSDPNHDPKEDRKKEVDRLLRGGVGIASEKEADLRKGIDDAYSDPKERGRMHDLASRVKNGEVAPDTLPYFTLDQLQAAGNKAQDRAGQYETAGDAAKWGGMAVGKTVPGPLGKVGGTIIGAGDKVAKQMAEEKRAEIAPILKELYDRHAAATGVGNIAEARRIEGVLGGILIRNRR